MKPVFKLTTMCWYVDGLGLFKSKEDALIAIEDNKLKHSLIIRISDKTQRQLQKIADKKKLSKSEIIRRLIEREVKDYGEEE